MSGIIKISKGTPVEFPGTRLTVPWDELTKLKSNDPTASKKVVEDFIKSRIKEVQGSESIPLFSIGPVRESIDRPKMNSRIPEGDNYCMEIDVAMDYVFFSLLFRQVIDFGFLR